MSAKTGLTITLGFGFLLIGTTQQNIVLLDVPFGLGFHAAEMLGLWRAGPSWIDENGWLSLFCVLAVPIMVSMLLGLVTAVIAYRLWNAGGSKSHTYTLIFVFTVYFLVLVVRAEPGVVHMSWQGHMGLNY